jgi:hypothetical protein
MINTSTGTRLAPALDRKLADIKQPLFDVVGWYGKACLATRDFNYSDLSANEDAALWLGIEFDSEADIGTRPCQCIRPDPNVCECWETLQAARAALTARAPEPIPEPIPDHDPDHAPTKEEVADRAREALRERSAEVIPHEIDLWSAMLFLAPLGHELAQEALALALRARPAYDETVNETVFQGRRYVTLLYGAFDEHPHYADCDPAPIIQSWQKVGIAAIESAYLVDWFCANHPSRAQQIERGLKLKLRKQGWRV